MFDRKIHAAQRDFRRAELQQGTTDLSWLANPSVVPEGVVNTPDTYSGSEFNPYRTLGAWFINQAVNHARSAHKHIDFDTIAEQQGVEGNLEDTFRDMVVSSYDPGFRVMMNIHQLVPAVATREGVPRRFWGDIALASEGLATVLAQSNTKRQSMFMFTHSQVYEEDFYEHRMRPDLFKLDDEIGVTTVHGLEQTVAEIDRINAEIYPDGYPEVQCLALQIKGSVPGRSLFHDYWKAFSLVTERDIYPGVIERAFWHESPAETSEDASARMQRMALVMEQMDTENFLRSLLDGGGDIDLQALAAMLGVDVDKF